MSYGSNFQPCGVLPFRKLYTTYTPTLRMIQGMSFVTATASAIARQVTTRILNTFADMETSRQARSLSKCRKELAETIRRVLTTCVLGIETRLFVVRIRHVVWNNVQIYPVNEPSEKDQDPRQDARNMFLLGCLRVRPERGHISAEYECCKYEQNDHERVFLQGTLRQI